MKADNFDDQSSIIVALNRIIGVRVISHSNSVWLSFSILYKLVLIMGLGYCVYFNCLWLQTDLYNYIACMIYLILLFTAAICVVSMQILGWWYYKDMSLLRKNIAETDESLKRMDVVVNHRNVFVWTVSICTISFFNGTWLFVGLVYLTYKHNFTITTFNFVFGDLLYAVLLYMGGIVALDFLVHVCWLRNNFKRTNDLLKKFFVEECQIGMEEWNNKMVFSWLQRCLNDWQIERISRRNKIIPYNGTQIMKRQLYPVNRTSMLQQIRYVHLQLCVITKSLNRIFDKQIMFFSTISTLNLLAIFYYFYAQSVDASPNYRESGQSMMILYILHAIYVWIKVVLLSHLCENTVKEAKEIVQIIHVCTIHNSDSELKNELIQFSLQVSLSEVDREDTHLFWLNDTFVSRSIGAVATYLLVMIQWNEASKSLDSSGTNSTVTI